MQCTRWCVRRFPSGSRSRRTVWISQRLHLAVHGRRCVRARVSNTGFVFFFFGGGHPAHLDVHREGAWCYRTKPTITHLFVDLWTKYSSICNGEQSTKYWTELYTTISGSWKGMGWEASPCCRKYIARSFGTSSQGAGGGWGGGEGGRSYEATRLRSTHFRQPLGGKKKKEKISGGGAPVFHVFR